MKALTDQTGLNGQPEQSASYPETILNFYFHEGKELFRRDEVIRLLTEEMNANKQLERMLDKAKSDLPSVKPIPGETSSVEAIQHRFDEWFKGHGKKFVGIKDGYIAGYLAGQKHLLNREPTGWVPISEYPPNSPVVQRWHKIYKCIVSVSHRRAYADNGCEWMSGTLDNTWPEDAFEPNFKALPDSEPLTQIKSER